MASATTDSNGVSIVRLTPCLKQRIVQLNDSGDNQTQIVNSLDDLSVAWPAVVQQAVSFNSGSQWILV